MTAISTCQHEKLMEFVQEKILNAEINNQQHFQHDVQLLQQFHERYQHKLSALRKLIADYELIQRRVKVELRKQQMMQKHKQYA